MAKDVAADKALIQDLGGPAQLAERLGTSVQVVWNWTKRGIPWEMKVKHPDLFLPQLKAASRKSRPAKVS